MKLALWLMMLFFNLLCPAVMVGLGRKFLKNPPKTINGAYGYRTRRSMQNQDTWDFAQKELGRIWLAVGKVMLPLAAAVQALTLLCSTPVAVCLWSIPITTAELVAMVLTLVPVERALKRNFDENGKSGKGGLAYAGRGDPGEKRPGGD